MSWAAEEFETVDLGDARLNRRAVLLAVDAPGHALPLVQGCVGWLVCRLLPSRTTSRPMISSSARWKRLGPTSGCSPRGAGISMTPSMSCAHCTMSPVASGQFIVAGATVQG